MTLKQQENIRLILFIAAYSISILSITNGNDMNRILSTYNLTMDDIRQYLYGLEDFMLLGAGWMEYITKEHKIVKEKYENIIHNISYLFEYVEVNDNPVKAFALYVYLYRNGYLSCNHKFCYSFDCKDLAGLTGADVITGKAVCRGISSMFTDIMLDTGFKASNNPVRVNPTKFNGLIKLCPTELEVDNKKNIGDVLSKIAQYIPITNHLITHLEYNGIKYDLDPTNDVLLTERNNRLYVSDSDKYYISHDRIWGIIPLLLGQVNNDIGCMLGIRDRQLPTISHEEYVRLYKETLKMITKNLDVFERFYKENKDSYLDIESTMNKQHSLMKRYMPILPIK